MPLQSSGSINLGQIQTELGGANPIGVDEYTGLNGLKSKFKYINSGTGVLSIIPGGAAFPPQGFNSLFSGHSDDGSLAELAFNFSYKFLGVTYTGLVVSPNTYITFGGSSSQFNNLSASNPPLPKIFMGSADNSHQRVSFKRGPENSYLHIRSEGAAQANDPGQGNPNIVYEIIFYDPRSTGGNSKFDLYIGGHARLAGLFKICSATSDILVPGNFGDPSEDTSLAQNNGYQFAGDANGNFWTVVRGTNNLLCVNDPINNPIQFSDFYGLSGTVQAEQFVATSGRVALFNGDGGSSSGWPPTGYTSIQNGTVDDAFVSISLPFTYILNNVTYQNNIFIGSNTYITFGSGSNNHNVLGPGNPNVPTLHIGSFDNSYQRVAYKSSTNYFIVRYEGTASTSGTPGSPNIVWEATFFRYENIDLDSTTFSDDEWGHIIMLNVGNHARTAGNFGISNGSAYEASGTIAAQTSYLIMGRGANAFTQRISTNARMVNVSEGFN